MELFNELPVIAFAVAAYQHPIGGGDVLGAYTDIPAVKSTPTPLPTATSYIIPSIGLPVRLKISSLGVDASIEQIGLNTAGNMDVPSSIINVGWYKLGALPGNVGTAVIAGHLDGVGNKPGVFLYLKKLQKGDTVSVTDDKNLTHTFVVRDTKTYDQDAHPSEVFASLSGSHLNLITCTGSWDTDINQFSKRLVVFTDLLP